jgi:3-deoxy-D-manno-octulosonic-acid transferase
MESLVGCESSRSSLMMLALYSFVMWCAQPFLRRKLARRGIAESGYLVNIEERFGAYTQAAESPTTPEQSFVWIHAVSLGETRAAAVLIDELREHLMGMKLLLTHGTATGREEGQKLLRNGDVQVWQAWDTVSATEGFIKHFKPKIGILMETELWPNMAAACAKLNVPLVIANARMSEKTYLKALKFAWLARPAYKSLKAVWPQSADDASRFEKLDAPVAGIFGNLKFDAQVDMLKLTRGENWKSSHPRQVVMFASSREGEELQLLEYLQNNASALTTVQWLIVPRHPQRFGEVATLIKQHGFKVSRRSDWLEQASESISENSAPSFHFPNDDKTILLGNSLGDMAMYYGMSDVALLGGSFEPLGGQNLIEAAACGCPVVMGTSTFNFAQTADQAMASQAAFQCQDLAQAVNLAIDLTQDAEALKHAQFSALKFAASRHGAAINTASAIQQLLG